jgi:hypothetical protein
MMAFMAVGQVGSVKPLLVGLKLIWVELYQLTPSISAKTA